MLPATQTLALLLALVCGWHGFRLVYDDKLAIDRALWWDGTALLLLAYFAWDGRRPDTSRARSRIAAWGRAHAVDIVLLGAIVGLAAFTRFDTFGKLPPTGYICCEEHINAGLAWDIVEGDRSYPYPLVRYSTALGIAIWGPSTFGIRILVVVASIATVVPLYLLMRELVGRPAALFSAAIYASLRALGDPTAHLHVPMFFTIVMIYTMIRGLRSGNLVWFVPAGLLGGLLSYEYEFIKAVPLFAATFLVFFALRALAWPLPRSPAALAARARDRAPAAAKAVVVIAVAVLIGLGPLIAQQHRGQRFYLASLNRQVGDRDLRGTPGFFAPNATTQLKYAAQVYTPALKQTFRDTSALATRGVIDDTTSVLIWVALIVAAATFWRGMRLLFVIWSAGGVLASALLLSNFAAWKMVGFMPPAIVLVGYFVDDALRLCRRFGHWTFVAGIAVVAALVPAILIPNVRTQRANASDPLVLREFASPQSQLFAMCDYLRHRPQGNYSFVAQRVKNGTGFTKPWVDDAEQLYVWGDFKPGCWDLRGRSLADLRELWPPPPLPAEQPVTVAMVGAAAEITASLEPLLRAMPELGDVDVDRESPAGAFRLVAYERTGGELAARSGVARRAILADGEAVDGGIATGPRFDLAMLPSSAVSFELSGLVYARGADASSGALVAAGASGLSLVAEGAPGVQVSIDGVPTTDAVGRPLARTALVEGWHRIDVRGPLPQAEPLRLSWRETSAPERSVAGTPPDPADFFAPADRALWTHTRQFARQRAGQIRSLQRYDFEPYVAALDGMRVARDTVVADEWGLIGDRWTARWRLDRAGVYTFAARSPGGAISLSIDGVALMGASDGVTVRDARMQLDAGDHDVELTFGGSTDQFGGGTLAVYDAAGNAVQMAIAPE